MNADLCKMVCTGASHLNFAVVYVHSLLVRGLNARGIIMIPIVFKDGELCS